jgi:hypothetical protein
VEIRGLKLEDSPGKKVIKTLITKTSQAWWEVDVGG